MKRAEAEKLLGGYATGTLTEVERRALFEASLEHQDLFDALADEEALRELLADPAARAHVLAALAPASEAGPPKVVPFWRRPGVLGAAAGIIVATTAGLAVLRSPEVRPQPLVKPEVAPAPMASAPLPSEAKATPPAPRARTSPQQNVLTSRTAGEPIAGNQPSAPAAAPAVASEAPPATPAQVPVPVAQAAGAGARATNAVAPGEATQTRMKAERHQLEARDQLSKKTEAAGMHRDVGGVAVVSSESALPRRLAAKAAPAPAGLSAPQPPEPVWTLETLVDGTTRVTVVASRQAQVVLLRRGASGVEVLKPGTAGVGEPWQFQFRLAPGDALDLYVLKGPVAEPARLPETGPVDGFRTRIHPSAKK
ncbi:hypothetical protein [Geothrix campi]|uniref:hypothetical protein n=1 Tax=Geothrix campi TaxID=2966450 RepID=UPI0021475354|nr:hypothetical protein [Geothrix sp. SG10]